MSGTGGFLAELQRRNVIRMAGLYVVGAWLIVQVAHTLLPIFDTPGWVLKTLVVLLAIGFLPALVFSWLYELTPEGLKPDAEVDPVRSITPQTAQRMDRLIFVGLFALIAVIAADRYWPRAETAATADTGQAAEDALPASATSSDVSASAERVKAASRVAAPAIEPGSIVIALADRDTARIRAARILCLFERPQMTNLTLSIDDEVLQRAREAALRDRTSVNALVRDYLTRYADSKRRRFEALDALDALAASTVSQSDARWSRDELHQRSNRAD